ncbi:alpha/beta-type small acid-soluble spore protein [Gorillibacterium timonense]|uniref:alpha/beta-type small acid-soluble spore protein n=1 Tax=Gorillibacterium timonense TaxID=1689269 RepID=UPI00071DF806|nr:alpha/beta-type small acid-soluble spore protein [Gorillibacterium timonense]
MARSNKKVVPEAKKALDAMKYEIAAELGLPVGQAYSGGGIADAEFAGELGSVSSGGYKKDYWGHLASRDNGAMGGNITKRLIEKAEEALFTI